MGKNPTRLLHREERRWLLEVARSAIDGELHGQPFKVEAPAAGPLTEHRGAFVTLTIDGDLRGCIGHVVGAEALWRSVESNAVNAAFRDPRFPAVDSKEMAGLTIEISALTPLRTISDVREIQVGQDGLIVDRGAYRGLLLPQVGERFGWTPEEFLDQTCRKAGMQAGCWRDSETRISAFSAEVFSEDDV